MLHAKDAATVCFLWFELRHGLQEREDEINLCTIFTRHVQASSEIESERASNAEDDG